jgi:hypothetical protein
MHNLGMSLFNVGLNLCTIYTSDMAQKTLQYQGPGKLFGSEGAELHPT